MPDPYEIDPQETAFLLDFDGTLAEIADHPDEVSLHSEVAAALARLRSLSADALAIVSGRAIRDLDRFLHPLVLPAAGVHGLELRGPEGRLRRGGFDEAALFRVAEAVEKFAARHAGLLAEAKPGAVALHYRKRPDLEAECIAFAGRLAAAVEGAALTRGKMVAELRLGGLSKADAVSAFMALPPFRGRIPLFAGDDVTDEDAFRRVGELGGVGVKVGPGETAANLRAPDIRSFHRWLTRVSEGRAATGLLEPARERPAYGPADEGRLRSLHGLTEGAGG